MSGSWVLYRKAQTVHIWFTTLNKLRGTIPFQIWKFLILLMALSTCIRRLAICCILTTSSADIWASLPKNGGMFRSTPRGRMFWIWNPLSAITESPSSKDWDKIPLRRMISRSEMLPVQSWVTNVMPPLGAIPTSPFNVNLVFERAEKFRVQK